MSIRVLLAEDHALVRSGVRALLEEFGDITVVGEAGTGRQAVEMAAELRPNLVLMDVGMHDLNGIDATRQIHTAQDDVRILMLSMHADRQYVFEALKAGATGYILKDGVVSELIAAIRTVAAGRRYITPSLGDVVLEDYVRRARGEQETDELSALSPREREVLQLVAEGHSSAEIARRLHVSVRTIDTHRQNTMEKLGIHSIAGLTKFAIRQGLCSLQ
jgi:DNA-binding NarL/FixJ family response regulator